MPKMTNKAMPQYFADPKIVPRVRQYVEAHGHLRVIDVSSIANHLQSQYSEYKRKKRSAFLKSVKKAFAAVNNCSKPPAIDLSQKLEKEYLARKQKHKNDESAEEDSASLSSDDMECIVYEDTNAINTLMSDCYKKSPAVNASFTIDRRGSNHEGPKHNVSLHEGLTGEGKVQTSVGTKGSALRETSTHEGPMRSASTATSLNGGMDDMSVFETPVKDTRQSLQGSTVKKDGGKSSKKRKKLSVLVDEDVAKKPRRDIAVTKPTSTFADVGGSEARLVEVCQLLLHMKHPEIYSHLGVQPPRGLLLHGPPGCGKTLLANAIAGELELPFLKVSAPEIVKGVSGESEEMLRDLFDMAKSVAPSIVFIDEIDAITPKREVASKDMERRIVAQLLTCLDDMNAAASSSGHVLVIGATNRADSLDPALRRAGRFDREVCLGIPDEEARGKILRILCRSLSLSPDFDYAHLAHNTPGYVGADLGSLTREAAISAVNRVFKKIEETYEKSQLTDKMHEQSTFRQSMLQQSTLQQSTLQQSTLQQSTLQQSTLQQSTLQQSTLPQSMLQQSTQQLSTLQQSKNISTHHSTHQHPTNVESLKSVLSWLKDIPPLTDDQLSDLSINMPDFEVALRHVQPSAKREGFATVPDVTWSDIGALRDIRDELQMAILAPVRHRKEFEALGLNKPPGVLLAGPPGCGKTLLAKAVANESGINFISVKGPELLNMYVGESERAVRQVFQRAMNSAPCVIFFDELDALCPRRADSGEGGSSVRVVNQMLTEMDGLEERRQVFVMAATNRPDIIDPAILRPGRLDKLLYVGLPSLSDRLDIFNTITKNGTIPSLASDVCLQDIADKCEGFTGADLSAVVREASVIALKEHMRPDKFESVSLVQVFKEHFTQALVKVRPSVSQSDHDRYLKLRNRCAR